MEERGRSFMEACLQATLPAFSALDEVRGHLWPLCSLVKEIHLKGSPAK